jgi:hypothetical protein
MSYVTLDLDYSGNDWDCDRPYRKRRDRCEPLAMESTAL